MARRGDWRAYVWNAVACVRAFMLTIMSASERPAPSFRSGNGLGPDGGTALAAPLERLTALQDLNIRCSGRGGGYGAGRKNMFGGGALPGRAANEKEGRKLVRGGRPTRSFYFITLKLKTKRPRRPPGGPSNLIWTITNLFNLDPQPFMFNLDLPV
jgi:hypothetical protein